MSILQDLGSRSPREEQGCAGIRWSLVRPGGQSQESPEGNRGKRAARFTRESRSEERRLERTAT